MKTIFISVASPIALRNFFLTPQSVFERLRAQKSTRIVIIAPEQATDAIKGDFGSPHNVFVEPVCVSHSKTPLQKVVTFFTTYLNFTDLMRMGASMGGRIDAPPPFFTRALYPLKAAIAATFGKVRFVRHVLAPALDALAYREHPHRALFEKYSPSLVFVTGIFSPLGRELIREARSKGIKSVGMTASWDHFPKRFEPVKPDVLLSWNESLKKEAIELQEYAPEQVFVVGVPHYDTFAHKELLMPRNEFFKSCNLNPQKKLVAFFSSSKYSPDDGDIVDILLRFARTGKMAYPSQLFIRPYPGVAVDREKFGRFEGDDLVYIDWTDIQKIWGDAAFSWYPDKSTFVWTANILHHADIIIGTYSSVIVEASAFLKPTLNINFDGYKQRPLEQSIKRSKYRSHYYRIFETGGVWQTESADDLLRFVNIFLENPESNKEGVKRLRDTMCWKVDGKSSERIARHIFNYLG